MTYFFLSNSIAYFIVGLFKRADANYLHEVGHFRNPTVTFFHSPSKPRYCFFILGIKLFRPTSLRVKHPATFKNFALRLNLMCTYFRTKLILSPFLRDCNYKSSYEHFLSVKQLCQDEFKVQIQFNFHHLILGERKNLIFIQRSYSNNSQLWKTKNAFVLL